jgi:hypothetical protein
LDSAQKHQLFCYPNRPQIIQSVLEKEANVQLLNGIEKK